MEHHRTLCDAVTEMASWEVGRLIIKKAPFIEKGFWREGVRRQEVILFL